LLGFLAPIRDFAQFIFTPVQFGISGVAMDLKQSTGFIFKLSSIHKENLLLIDENAALKSTIVNLKIADEENQLLKHQLDIKNKNSFDKKLVLANVMGNSTDLSGASVILDKGSKYGIKKGDNVIRGSYIVGIVNEVTSERSVVDLIISPSISMAVSDIDTKNKTEGVAVGEYGTSVLMKRILPTEDIKVGDTIITSGKDGIFEPNLIVGLVTEVVQVPVEPLKSAYVNTIIDLVNLDRVFIIVTQ
jgi:rod shape-determining protein MreC